MNYNEANVSETLFNADAPYIYDGKGNYTFSLRSLAILFNKIVIDNKVEIPRIENVRTCEVPKVEETPKRKIRPIDWGKATALKKAGWTPKAIAEDIGASIAEVNAYFLI